MSSVDDRLKNLSPEQRKMILQKIAAKNAAKANVVEELPKIKPVDDAAYPNGYPLSFSQKRLWFMYQWNKEDSSYNVPCLVRLSFDVQFEQLQEAVDRLMEHHEVLRTTYGSYEDEPYQIIQPFIQVPIEIIDVRDKGLTKEEFKETYLVEKASIPFNIEKEIPIRIYLFLYAEEENYLLLNIHHIACDGSSVNTIMKELLTAYEEVEHPFNENNQAVRYVDFACWQKEYEKTDTFQKHGAYWKNVFEGEIPILHLPTDRKRPAVKSDLGRTISKTLPEQVYKQLTSVCQQEDITSHMLTLAAFSLLLYKYTGQTDMVIGSPNANRNYVEIEEVIGFFINTLPMRIQVDEEMAVQDFLKYVKKVCYSAYEHQDYPLEKIIEMLPISRDLSYTPLFQVEFVTQNMYITHSNDVERKMWFEGGFINHTSKFDLTLSVAYQSIELEYCTDLFDEHTMEQFLQHYVNVLASMFANLDRPVKEIRLISETEKLRILDHVMTAEATNEEHFSIVGCLEQEAIEEKNQIALVYEDRQYTYEQLNRKVNQFAHYITSKSTKDDDVVGIFLERTDEYVIAMLAILKARKAYLPLDPTYPDQRVEHMIKQSGMKLMITKKDLLIDRKIQPEQVCYMDEEEDAIERMSMDNPDLPYDPHQLMYIIFTSGSTGLPKGVAVEHRNFVNYIQGMKAHLQLEQGKSFAIISTLAADLGLFNVFGALCSGGTLHVISYDCSCDPDSVAMYFKNHRIDIMKAVPSHIEVLLTAEQKEYIIPHEMLILAGEGLSYDLVQRIRTLRPDCQLENHYGPTETTVSAMAYSIPTDDWSEKMVPLGKPIAGVKAYVLDHNQNLLPPKIPGELYIGGNGVSRGYIGDITRTKERFLANPYCENDIMYRTGDRVQLREDGVIEILDRIDRQVKIRGFRIELGEIESVLKTVPFIDDCAVVVWEAKKTDKRIVAYVVLNKEYESSNPVKEIRTAIGDQLPQYMMPSHMMMIEKMPLNANGKADLQHLPKFELTSNESVDQNTLPQTELEQRIHDKWCEVLELEQISIDDDFFELGGDSFKALKVTRQICDWIGIMEFFKNPTIRELAAYIEKGVRAEAQTIHQLRTTKNHKKTRLSVICVPFAGGSAITFQTLAAQLPDDYAAYAVEIPGHDFTRPEEPLLPLEESARMCVEEIKEKIDGPIALYGHCVGGALTMAIAKQLEEENLPLEHIFVGGALPIARLPGKLFVLMSKLFPSDRSMSNKAYHDFLKALGGFDDVVDTEERDFLIRNLRHDARESEAYFTKAYNNEEQCKMKAPITCIVGERDRSTDLYEERYMEWTQFSNQVDLAVIPQAGHYFMKHQADQLSEVIDQRIRPKSQQTIQKGHDYSGRQQTVVLTQQDMKKSIRMFIMVVISQLVSLLGSGLTTIALGVWVFAKSGAVTDFAAISSASMIPGILALPIAGAIVDRYDRRLVMLFSDVAAALSIAGLAVLVGTGQIEVWHIYVASSISSISRSFHRPAFNASVAQIIPKQYLGHANGIVQFASSTSEMIAPLIGVALYTMIGIENIFIMDFLSFSVGIVTLLIVRFPNTLFHRQEEGFIKEVLMGWRFIIKRRGMRYLILFFFVGNVLYGGVTVLFQPLMLSIGDANQLAITSMLGAIGGMVGALIMSLWGGTKRRATGMIGFVIGEGVAAVLAGISPSFLFPAVGIFGFYCCLTLSNAHWQSLIQAKVGLELQGRVLATNQMMATSSVPIGYWLAGKLSDQVFEKGMMKGGALADTFGHILGTGAGRGIGLLLVLSGIIIVLWSTFGYRLKPLRYIEDEMKDAIPDAVIKSRDELQAELDQAAV